MIIVLDGDQPADSEKDRENFAKNDYDFFLVKHRGQDRVYMYMMQQLARSVNEHKTLSIGVH